MCDKKMINKIFKFVYGATGTVIEIPSDINGWIAKMIVVTPDFTNAVTSTLTITDPDGIVVYTSAALAENLTTPLGDLIGTAKTGEIPIGEHPWKMTCTLSGVAGAGGGIVKCAVYLKG